MASDTIYGQSGTIKEMMDTTIEGEEGNDTINGEEGDDNKWTGEGGPGDDSGGNDATGYIGYGGAYRRRNTMDWGWR